MYPIHWTQDMQLGIPEMDESHRAMLDELNRLAQADDADLMDRFARLVASIERDFREEEDTMERIDYMDLRPHCEHHARTLSGLHHAASLGWQGDLSEVRRAIELLPQWFVMHLHTMDIRLAMAIRTTDDARV